MMVITTAQTDLAKCELNFSTDSSQSMSISKVCDKESATSQKQKNLPLPTTPSKIIDKPMIGAVLKFS